jgi:hypothetical protein
MPPSETNVKLADTTGLWELIGHVIFASGVLDNDVEGTIIVPAPAVPIVVICGHGVSAGSQTFDLHDEHVTLFEAFVQQIMQRYCLRHLSPRSCICIGKHNGENAEGRGEGPGDLGIIHCSSQANPAPHPYRCLTDRLEMVQQMPHSRLQAEISPGRTEVFYT